jgi:S-adenosylmethionine:tRNA ribosyltransferase-isomerase
MKQIHCTASDFDYDLPADRIPDRPAASREGAKLLIYKSGTISDLNFSDVVSAVPQNAQLVVNDTRVIHARLYLEKETGGKVQVFLLQPFNATVEEAMSHRSESMWWCLVGGAKKWKDGLIKLTHEGVTISAERVNRDDEKFLIRLTWSSDVSFAELIDVVGNIPLPPYMLREADHDDVLRYQTTYAKQPGSVAAPTAGLHFTPEIISAMQAEVVPVTLHVSAGTFKPVTQDNIVDHTMHEEECIVPLSAIKGLSIKTPRFAVGTTSLRTLESLRWIAVKWFHTNIPQHEVSQTDAYDFVDPFVCFEDAMAFLAEQVEAQQWDGCRFKTAIMISPGYEVKSITGLFTNFHMPKSTLLFLVSALIGDDWKKVYSHALDSEYRFLSYGDSSLLIP